MSQLCRTQLFATFCHSQPPLLARCTLDYDVHCNGPFFCTMALFSVIRLLSSQRRALQALCTCHPLLIAGSAPVRFGWTADLNPQFCMQRNSKILGGLGYTACRVQSLPSHYLGGVPSEVGAEFWSSRSRGL
jgi:hypothetical protein